MFRDGVGCCVCCAQKVSMEEMALPLPHVEQKPCKCELSIVQAAHRHGSLSCCPLICSGGGEAGGACRPSRGC